MILKLNWWEITKAPPAEFPEFGELVQALALNIDALVQQVRAQRFDKIQDQCGLLQLLDISRPVGIDDLLLECALNRSQDFAHAQACGNALNNILGVVLDVGLDKSLQQLRDKFPDPNQNRERFQLWWQAHYSAWDEQLKTTLINYRNINQHWQFSQQQQQVLQRYYDANQLLLDCLNSNCEVMAAIRQEIEVTLLLPQKELKEREWQ